MNLLALWDWHSFWVGFTACFMVIFLLLAAAAWGFSLGEKQAKL